MIRQRVVILSRQAKDLQSPDRALYREDLLA